MAQNENKNPANPTDTGTSSDAAPSEKGTGQGDGLLDSLGKALIAPVIGAAEPDEKSIEKPATKPGN